MKINLKEKIFIEGFDNPKDYFLNPSNEIIKASKIIYSGKTSEISEELAKECVTNYGILNDNPFHNYKVESQYFEYLFKTAKESIQSACSQEYCIIYKEN